MFCLTSRNGHLLFLEKAKRNTYITGLDDICLANDDQLAVGAGTVPVKVGLASGAIRSRALCVAVEIGVFKSAALSTLFSPTMHFVMPLTLPVKVGLDSGAFDASWFCTVVA